MNSKPNARQLQILKLLCDTIIESVREAGVMGMPAGNLYAALMPSGISLEQFERLMGSLVNIGQLHKRNQVYYTGRV